MPDTGDGLPITDYNVEYRPLGVTTWTDHPFTGTTTQTTLTGLTPETAYEVRVLAFNADSASAWSSPGQGATAGDNRAPQFAQVATLRSVPENAPAGHPTGRPGHGHRP